MKSKSNRLKPILPTLKEKKRYLAFEILSKSQIKDFLDVSKAIWSSALSFNGIKGVAIMGLDVLPEKYHVQKQKGLLKVTHRSLDAIRASLALITTIGQEPVIVRSLGASGIIAKAEKKYFGG